MDRISLPHLSSPQHYTREREVPLKSTCVLFLEILFKLNRNPDSGLSLWTIDGLDQGAPHNTTTSVLRDLEYVVVALV